MSLETRTTSAPLDPLALLAGAGAVPTPPPAPAAPPIPPPATAGAPQVRPHIARVESNAKGGVGVDLAPKVLVVGDNGTGKSTLVNAVELALTGRAGDIAGRVEVAREADLMALAPGRSGKLFSTVRLSDGSVCEWSCSGTTESAKKAKKARFAGTVGVLPLREVREALAGSPATAREYFLRRTAGVVTRAQVLVHVPEPLRALFAQAAGGAPAREGEPVDEIARLLYARDAAAAGAREATARAKAAREAAASVGAGLAPPPSEEELTRTRAAVAEAQKAVEEAVRIEARAGERARLQAQLDAARRDAAAKQSALQAAHAHLARTPAPPQLSDTYRACIAALRALAAEKQDRCLVCDTSGVGARISERDARVTAQLSTWRTMDGAHREAKAAHAAAFAAYNQAAQTVLSLEAACNVLIAPSDAPPMDEAAARLRLGETQNALRALEAAREAWRVAQKAAAPAEGTKTDAALWKALAKACDEAVEAILDRAVEEFRAKVQAYLPKADAFALRLRDGAREVFQVGFLREGVVHTALSGAEWARMTAALAAALALPDGPCVIVPEERAFDPHTLVEACEALGKAADRVGAQVIVTSAVEPSRAPAGFVVLRTTKL